MKILFLEPSEYEDSIELRTYLQSSNHIIHSVENFHNAFKIIAQNQIDLIFVNLNFHYFNPYSFIQNVKLEKELNEITIISLLQTDDHYNFQKALISGSDFCLTKPYEPNFKEIEDLLNSKSNHEVFDNEHRKYITFSQKLILELEEKISHLEENNRSLTHKNQELKRLSVNLDEMNDLTNLYIHKLNEIELSSSPQDLLEKLEQLILNIFKVESLELLLYQRERGIFHSAESERDLNYSLKLSEIIISGRNNELKKALELDPSSDFHLFTMTNKSLLYKDMDNSDYKCQLNHKSDYCDKCFDRYIHGIIIVKDSQNNLNSSKEKLLHSFINQSVLIYEHKLLVEHLNILYHNAEKKAITDPLTEIFNKRFFIKSLEQKFYYSKRSSTPLSLIMIDIDFFKRYNDKFGHPAGDMLLKEFALLIEKSIRKSDIFARYGGEEFSIITPGLDNNEAKKLAEKLRELIEKNKFKVKGEQGSDQITASFGVGTVNEDIKNYDQLIEFADKNLYLAKKSGRNLVR